MITGIVTSNREAIIQVHLLGSKGQEEIVDAIIDTGVQ